jgi:hypothetical protein
MRTSILLGLMAALAAGNRIAAQDSTGTLRPGRTIRVSGQEGLRLVGELMTRDSASMVIRPAGSVAKRVPLGRIRRVEVRTAHKSRAGSGAAIGAGAGAVLGLVLVADVDNDEFLGTDCCSAGEYGLGAVVFAAGGAGIGALIGAASHKDTWARVPAEEWQITPGALPEPEDRPVAQRGQPRPRKSRGGREGYRCAILPTLDMRRDTSSSVE